MTSEHGERRAQPASDEAAYDGVTGRTRTEVMQVWMPDGSIRALPVYVAVDVQADPEIAALARAGTLHHVTDDVDLAIAFLYHDREARLFVLVVPEALRHRALAMRAEQMTLIAGDVEHGVPAYVRELEVAIGARELCARIERESGRAAMPLHAGEQAIVAEALHQRERDLERRERLVRAREVALSIRRDSLRLVHDAELEDFEAEPSSEQVDRTSYERDTFADEDLDGMEEAEDSELEEVEDFDDEGASEDDGEGDDQDEAAVDVDDDVADYEGADDSELESGALTRAVWLNDRAERTRDSLRALVPPPWFAEDPTEPLCLVATSGRVWLFVRGESDWSGAEMDFLVQVDPHAAVPVALATFVFDGASGTNVLRSVIDVDDAAQRDALNLLTEHYEVEIIAWSGDASLEHWATLRAGRERNVRAVLAHLEPHLPLERASFEASRALLLARPPPYRDRTHPFQDLSPRDQPATATEAAVLLDEIAEWLTAERRRRLLLMLCVPDEVIDWGLREVIAFALDWGLSLPANIAARALELGIEKDEPSLLLRRIEGLCRTSRASDYGGLEESVLRTLWSETLEHAARLGVSLPDAAREQAEAHCGDRAAVHAAALADSDDSRLTMLRSLLLAELPDVQALEELATSGVYRDVLSVCRTTIKLDADQAARVFVRVSRRGDPVAIDALLSLVSQGEHLRVRVGAAFSLASRHAVNAIDELAGHVAREGDPEWRLFALALGRYGAGSFRAICRALEAESADTERVEEVHAHLALHGARAQVRARARSPNEAESRAAERALTRASELRDGKNPVLGLEQQGPLTVFCETFDRYVRDMPKDART